MLAFEVYVNTVKVCTAAVDDFDFVGATLSSVMKKDGSPQERKVHFFVHGMNLEEKKPHQWVRYALEKGHKIEIRIVEAKKVDPATEVKCSGGSCAT